MIRVLMVDDDPSILEVSAIFLERAGDIKVDVAESAADALKRLLDETRPYDVVISDYAMPEMDGIAFLKAVRSRDPHIPFILFTGKSREEVVIEALNSGADYYIQKDGNPKVLFTELSHQIRQAAGREKARKADLVQRDLALKLSGATSLSVALKLCVNAAIEVSETDCGTMYLLDRATGTYVLIHSTGFSPEYLEAISKRRRNPSTSLISKAVEPIYIGYQDKSLPLQKAREQEGLRAMAVVPIHHEGGVIGYYSVGTHTSDEVPLSGRSALETIAAITENAIFRLQAEEELRKSEENYRALVEGQTDLICRFFPDGTITFVNEAYCRYFKKSRTEFVGQSIFCLVPEEVRERIIEKMTTLTKDRPTTTSVHKAILPEGDVRWLQWTDRAILDDCGTIVEFQSSGEDVTNLKVAEEALKESEERLKMAVEGGKLGIWDWNLVTGEETFNEKWADILGYSRQDLEKTLGIWGRLIHPDDRAEAKRALNDHLAGLTPYCETELRMMSKDGRWVWIHGRGKVVSKDGNGRPTRVIGVIQDLNETRRFREPLQQTKS